MRTDAFWVLRNEVSIDRVIEVNGSRKVSCISPTHQDDHPSMHVYDDHVHCFGCGLHGDVTDVWAVLRGIERPIEAALDLAREFNVRLPEMTPEARQRFQERRRREGEAMEMARGHHTLLKRRAEVLEWWEGRGFGPELRERFLLGAKGGGSSATLPFWNRGRVVGIIHRNLSGEPKYVLPAAEEFPEGHKPLFIPGPLGNEVFLVEGYIDALAIAGTGRGAIAVGGTALSEAQQEELDRLLPENCRLVILPDADNEGSRAAQKWVRTLFPRARVAEPAYGHGAKDIADTFSALGPEGTGDLIDGLVKDAKDALDLEIEAAGKIEHQRDRLAYAAEHIAPLLLRITSGSMRDAAADQVADYLKIKKPWLKNAMKDAEEEARQLRVVYQQAVEEQERQALLEEAQPEIDALF